MFKLYDKELDLFELFFLHDLNYVDDLSKVPDIIIIDDKLSDDNKIREYARISNAQLVKLDDDTLKFIEANPSLYLDGVIDNGNYVMLKKFIDFLNNNDMPRCKEIILLKYLFDVNDDYTRMHSENVSIYAMMLGSKLGLSERNLKKLRIGGLFHDIGKLGMPDKIIKGENKLTDDEYEYIKLHPIIGECVIGNYLDDDIKMIIRNHHERIDGKGYPDGLSGAEIPLLVKIISVADCFDAMTSNRAYKNKKSIYEVFEELKRVSENTNGNQQLDRELVNIFISMIKSNCELMAYFNREFDCKEEDEIRRLVLK